MVTVGEIKHNHNILEFQSWVAPFREYKIEVTTVFCMHAGSATHSSNAGVVLQSFAILNRSLICEACKHFFGLPPVSHHPLSGTGIL